MADILHEFPIFVPVERVFEAVSTPAGLDAWWTLTSRGKAVEGSVYDLGFGEGYDWQAVVTTARPGSRFELQMTQADPDWMGTRVGFSLAAENDRTNVRFHHLGWPGETDHFRISCFCWAMYLRIMKRYLEFGETIDYAKRLDV